MQISVTDHLGKIISLDVTAELDVSTLKALLEIEFGVPVNGQLVYHGTTLLDNDSATIESLGIRDQDLLMLHPVNSPQRRRSSGTRAARTNPVDLSAFDFSSIQVDGNRVLPSNSAMTTDAGHHPDANALRPDIAPTIAKRQAEAIIQKAGNDPSFLPRLEMKSPDLAAAIRAGNASDVEAIVLSNIQEVAERERKVRLAMSDPLSREAQQLMYEAVQKHNIEESLLHAQEYIPESFGSVFMLYVKVEVNGKPLAAFVDSGAQATLMSTKCVERVDLLRLIDERFQGIAKGVGTSKIVGRIHVAQVKMGNKFFQASVTVLEDDKVDFLFGLDLLRRYQCKIDLENNCLAIADERLPFLSEAQVRDMHIATFGAEGSGDILGMGYGNRDISSLTDMGFSENEARAALIAADGSVDNATAILLANRQQS